MITLEQGDEEGKKVVQSKKERRKKSQTGPIVEGREDGVLK